MYKISVCIPYKRRLENLSLVFEALAQQTMQKDEFEVVLGVMEYCVDFVELCKKFCDQLNITPVMSGKDFSIPRARNLAMRQATGEVILQMDADTLLPTNSLETLYNRYFAFNQKICVIGQVVGYGNNNDGDVTSVDNLEYKDYQPALQLMEVPPKESKDPRFQVSHVIPWAFGWTGFIALPRSCIIEHNLFFDETFHGWGVDDLEWSFRICYAKIPMVMGRELCAIHLPHIRDQAANQKTEKRNYERFLHKWPQLDVELAYAFGDVAANDMFLNFITELRALVQERGEQISIVRGKVQGKNLIVTGVSVIDGKVITPSILEDFDSITDIEILPLLGMALPYPDHEFKEARVLPVLNNLSKQYKDKILAELGRVSEVVKVAE